MLLHQSRCKVDQNGQNHQDGGDGKGHTELTLFLCVNVEGDGQRCAGSGKTVNDAIDRMGETELVETFVAGCADLLGVAFIIGISRGITVLMNDGAITDTILHWGERALAGAGPVTFVLLVFLLYLPLTVLIPSSSGLATLSIPVIAPLGRFAGVSGDLVVTAFQSASGLVNILTPTAAVVMGALALGRVPYDKWLGYVWKLLVYFALITILFLIAGTIF